MHEETGGAAATPEASGEAKGTYWPYIGVGCFTAPIGFFGGGMIAVLIAKIVGAVQGCVAPEGFPACHTWEFLVPGALLGLVGLPTMALVRLHQGRRTPGDSNNRSR